MKIREVLLKLLDLVATNRELVAFAEPSLALAANGKFASWLLDFVVTE